MRTSLINGTIVVIFLTEGLSLFHRWNGVAARKPWKKSFLGCNREKKQQLSVSEQWHMPSLIRSTNYENICIHWLLYLMILLKASASHFDLQWRANPTQYLGQAYYSIGKENWGWSCKERWIAARPWEIRVHAQPSNPKKGQIMQDTKLTLTTKAALSNEKVTKN